MKNIPVTPTKLQQNVSLHFLRYKVYKTTYQKSTNIEASQRVNKGPVPLERIAVAFANDIRNYCIPGYS